MEEQDPTAEAFGAREMTNGLPREWTDPVMISALLEDLARPLGDVVAFVDEQSGRTGFKVDFGGAWAVVHVFGDCGDSFERKRLAWSFAMMRWLAPRLRRVLEAIATKGARDFVVISRVEYDRLVVRSAELDSVRQR